MPLESSPQIPSGGPGPFPRASGRTSHHVDPRTHTTPPRPLVASESSQQRTPISTSLFVTPQVTFMAVEQQPVTPVAKTLATGARQLVSPVSAGYGFPSPAGAMHRSNSIPSLTKLAESERGDSLRYGRPHRMIRATFAKPGELTASSRAQLPSLRASSSTSIATLSSIRTGAAAGQQSVGQFMGQPVEQSGPALRQAQRRANLPSLFASDTTQVATTTTSPPVEASVVSPPPPTLASISSGHHQQPITIPPLFVSASSSSWVPKRGCPVSSGPLVAGERRLTAPPPSSSTSSHRGSRRRLAASEESVRAVTTAAANNAFRSPNGKRPQPHLRPVGTPVGLPRVPSRVFEEARRLTPTSATPPRDSHATRSPTHRPLLVPGATEGPVTSPRGTAGASWPYVFDSLTATEHVSAAPISATDNFLAYSFSGGALEEEHRAVGHIANPVNMWIHERGIFRNIFGGGGSKPAAAPSTAVSPPVSPRAGAPSITAVSKEARSSACTSPASGRASLFHTEASVTPRRMGAGPHGRTMSVDPTGPTGSVADFGADLLPHPDKRSSCSDGDDGKPGSSAPGWRRTYADDYGRSDGGGGGGDEHSDLEGEVAPRMQRGMRTRNLNALRSYAWDQRMFLPYSSGCLAQVFRLLSSPRFIEKIDWALRASVLTILPVMILCLEDRSKKIFPLPTSAVALAFWISQPTLGAGLRELYIVLKGVSFSLAVMCIFLALQPGPAWLSLLLLFVSVLVLAFVGEQLKRTCAFCLTSIVMQYIRSPATTEYKYVGDYYVTLLIALGFGLAAFFVPYTRWSSDVARHYIEVLGDSISTSARCACAAFWVRSPLERQLLLARLRQLRRTAAKCVKKASASLSEMGYEPHSGTYTAQLKTRLAFLKSVASTLDCLVLLVEEITNNPSSVETLLCLASGQRIRPHLVRLAYAMDTTIMRVVDLDHLVSAEDIDKFRLERDSFEAAVAATREEVILNNEDYVTDSSDILQGFFLFSIQALCDTIGNYKEDSKPPNNLYYLLNFPLRDLKTFVDACKMLVICAVRRHTLTRRMKEALKISLCIVIAGFFQVYALGDLNNTSGPAVGVDIIALVYRPTGAESFQYATNRLMGTVLGSLTGLLAVQLAQERRWVLYLCTVALTLVGAYVQGAPGFFPLGNAICNSVISIVLQYRNQTAAMTRIQQNCFAILTYFIISSVVWPMRGRTKVKYGLDMSLRLFRETTHRLLCNLDMPESAKEVNDDTKKLIAGVVKRIGQQSTHLPGANAEPTMDSAEFPDLAWHTLIGAQEKMLATVSMMRAAYESFMLSTVGTEAGVSVHWVVLHRISPYATQLSDLLSAAIDIYLLALSKATIVPTAHLARIRHGMIECHHSIVRTFIETVTREVGGGGGSYSCDSRTMSSDDEGGGGWSQSRYFASSTGTIANDMEKGLSEMSPASTTDALSQQQQQQKQSSQAPSQEPNADGAGRAGHGAAVAEATNKADTQHPRATDANPQKQSTRQRQRRRGGGYLAYKLRPEEQETIRHLLNASFRDGDLAAAMREAAGVVQRNATYNAPASSSGSSSSSSGSQGGSPRTHSFVGSLSFTRVGGSRLTGSTAGPTHSANGTFVGTRPNRSFFSRLGNHSFLANRSFFGKSLHKSSSKAKAGDGGDRVGTHDLENTVTDDGVHDSAMNDVVTTASASHVERATTEEGTGGSPQQQPAAVDATLRGQWGPLAVEYLSNVVGSRPRALRLGEAVPPVTSSSSSPRFSANTMTSPMPPGSHRTTARATDDAVTPAAAPGSSSPLSCADRSPPSPAGAAVPATDGKPSSPSPQCSPTVPLLDTAAALRAVGPTERPAKDARSCSGSTATSVAATLVGGTAERSVSAVSSLNDIPTTPPLGSLSRLHFPRDDKTSSAGVVLDLSELHPSRAPSRTSSIFSRRGAGGQNVTTVLHRFENLLHANGHHDDDGGDESRSHGGSSIRSANTRRVRLGTEIHHHFPSDHDSDSTSTSSRNNGRGRNSAVRPGISRGDNDSGGDGESGSGGEAKALLDQLTFFDSENGEFVLTNRDIHGLEAFLFGISALVTQMEEFEKKLLEMIHDYEMARKL